MSDLRIYDDFSEKPYNRPYNSTGTEFQSNNKFGDPSTIVATLSVNNNLIQRVKHMRILHLFVG